MEKWVQTKIKIKKNSLPFSLPASSSISVTAVNSSHCYRLCTQKNIIFVQQQKQRKAACGNIKQCNPPKTFLKNNSTNENY